MFATKRLIGLTLLLLLAVGLTGCGPGTATVSGEVTYNGAPVTGGTVTFTPVGRGVPATVELDESGKFSNQKVPAGEVVITVDNRGLKGNSGPAGMSGEYPQGEKPTGSQPGQQNPNAGPPKMKMGDMESEMRKKGAPGTSSSSGRGTYMKIPDKYYSGQSTDLKMTIKSGDHLKLELKD